MKLRVMQDYRSSYVPGGWKAGEEVEVEAWLAAKVEDDAPGTLQAVDFMKDFLGLEQGVGSFSVDNPPADRMVRAPGKKRGNQNG